MGVGFRMNLEGFREGLWVRVRMGAHWNLEMDLSVTGVTMVGGGRACGGLTERFRGLGGFNGGVETDGLGGETRGGVKIEKGSDWLRRTEEWGVLSEGFRGWGIISEGFRGPGRGS